MSVAAFCGECSRICSKMDVRSVSARSVMLTRNRSGFARYLPEYFARSSAETRFQS